jgi:hypothetical protein
MIVQKLADSAAGWICGATVGGSALLLWYGIGYMKLETSRMSSAEKKDQQDEKNEGGFRS